MYCVLLQKICFKHVSTINIYPYLTVVEMNNFIYMGCYTWWLLFDMTYVESRKQYILIQGVLFKVQP